MAKTKTSKKEVLKKIDEFFLDIENKTPREIMKIKKLVMSLNIKLGDKKKTFCKKCLNHYKNPKVRVKNNMKTIVCENCGHVARWKIKTS